MSKWCNDRTGIREIAVGLGGDRWVVDVYVEFDDKTSVRRAAVVGSLCGPTAPTSDGAKLALADRLERLASLIRNDVIDRQEKKREEKKRRGDR